MKFSFTNILNAFRGSGNVAAEKAVESPKEAFNRNRETWLHKSICFAPSVNMVFGQDGGVKACCHNAENLLGRYPQQSIKEIWTSEEAKTFRNKLSEYKL